MECKEVRCRGFVTVDSCINRNIVECKEGQGWATGRNYGRINRNIVECKESSCFAFYRRNTCINRNIVECKGFNKVLVSCSEEVLIETLWNVKWKFTMSPTLYVFVLIETLWNVKLEQSPCLSLSTRRY